MKTQNAAILSLPSEIIDMIWVQLSNLELKNTRLSCRYLRKLGTPMLFADFNLYPHIRSFEKLVSISESENIRHHIQTLSYFPDFNGVLPRFIKQIESVWSCEVSTAEKDRILAHARLLESQTLRINLAKDNMIQMEYLLRVFPRLDNLKSIKLIELTFEESMFLDDEELPHFYEQMKHETCNQYRHLRLPKDAIAFHEPTPGTCAQMLLIASGRLQNPLQSLEFEGLNWVSFLQGGDFSTNNSSYNKHFANLRTLRLCGDCYSCFPLPGFLMQNLQHLLTMAANLERLEISIDKDTVANIGPPHTRLARQVKRISMFDPNSRARPHLKPPARLTWAKSLHQLILRGLRCTASEFKTLLRPCAATLEFLVLDDIELLPESRQPDAPRACWVKVMKWMQRHLVKLKDIRFCDGISNGGKQKWLINSMKNHQGCLLQRVRQFFLEGGPCPLELLAIKPGARDFVLEASGPVIPGRLPDVWKYQGDSSWWIEHGHLEGLYDESDDDEDEYSDEDEYFDDDEYFDVNEDEDEDEDGGFDWNEFGPEAELYGDDDP